MENTYYYHGDHLGSMSWITDGNGDIIEHRRYLPYGETWYEKRFNTSTYVERFRFTGKERDQESGYDYFGARYLDAMILTSWLSIDPIVKCNESPYLYCGGNPIRMVDPDGRDWYEETGHWDVNLTSPTCGQYVKGGGIKWTDKNSQLELGTEGIYLGTDVLVGTHNRDANLNEAPNTAQFDLYLSSNPEGPTATIMGNTIPDDVNSMGTMPEGLYSAEYRVYKGKPALLLNGGKPMPTVKGGSAKNPLNHLGNNTNNPMKPVNEHVMDGVYFHFGNNYGTDLHDSNGHAWSKGCQTGGNYKGSWKDYLNFMKKVPTNFNGSYYLRGK